MRVTHTDYKHPRHLRVLDNGRVLCVSPSSSAYAKLNRPGLPSHTLADVRREREERYGPVFAALARDMLRL